ncbi:hypothetical protein PAXRUDRAFT_162143 [Paxillus rubicundulus Ve08.2h10]|uniref:Uncharacterized protein n=1 Tax=Paxillus rubicundulus Ve08.2h10 TaxID=930991 RepID=A0A0D0CUJ6_9AGAM|nr:hypothetical protein PAXRUDRAFT_162143 [Paxillus rubicundulus Ve08.2h10]
MLCEVNPSNITINEMDAHYYMGGMGNSNGLQEEHLQALNALDGEDKPELPGDEEVDVGPSLVIDAFSDNKAPNNVSDDWW